jgi:outer membrane protein assembly factor BamB
MKNSTRGFVVLLNLGLSVTTLLTAAADNPALGDWKPFTKPSRGFDPKANLDLVPNAEFAVGEDEYGPIVRVNLLKITDWTAVPGIQKAWKAHYKSPNADDTFSNLILSEVIDVDDSQRFHAFSCIDWYKSHIARYDENGACLWVSKVLPHRAGDESRLPVVDLDGDGTLEVLSTQKYPEKGGGAIVCLDAETGQLNWQRNFEGDVQKVMEHPMAVGHFSDTATYDIVARFDKYLYCIDAAGDLRWKHSHSDEYEYGHELYWSDVDGDGLDEIFVSTEQRMTALRGDGTMMWQDDTSKRHSDFIGCGDMDEDGRIEVVYDHDGCGGAGPIYIADALTGELESTVDYRSAGLGHAQGGVVGKFRADVPGMQIFNGVCLFDNQGNLLWKNNAAGSLASSGDWDGDGVLEAMCFALGTNRDGIFSVWDGHGKRKYAISFLPSPVHLHGIAHAGPAGRIGRLRQTDMTGDGKADVVMSFGRWGNSPDQFLFIMGQPAEGQPRLSN